MTKPHPSASVSEVDAIHQLLVSYSFDPEDYPPRVVIAGWLDQFGPIWVSHAITEALYQGRYKLVSIDQILQLWQRRGQPIRHFNREFESIILGQTLLIPTSAGEGEAIASLPPSGSQPQTPTPQAAAEGEAQSPEADRHSLDPETAAAIAPSPPLPASHFPGADIPNFRPLGAHLSLAWGPADAIQPFVPRHDESDLHQRLRAVVQAGMAE